MAWLLVVLAGLLAGTAVVGMAALGEAVNPVRIGSVVLVVAGVVGLSLSSESTS